MGLLRLGILGAAGYGIYKYAMSKSASGQAAAFATGEGAPGNATQIRNAGPESMRDQPNRWSAEDEASDASFPASDPPGTY